VLTVIKYTVSAKPPNNKRPTNDTTHVYSDTPVHSSRNAPTTKETDLVIYRKPQTHEISTKVTNTRGSPRERRQLQ